MRVISQNGKISIPFEHCVVTCDSNLIHCAAVMNSDQFIVGEYSTVEKAQKAMEMMHKTYIGIMPSLVIDHTADLSPEDLEVVLKSNVGAVIKPADANPCSIEIQMLPRVFKFPADDEIEVME